MRKSLKILIGIPVYNEENFIFQGIQDIISFIRSNPDSTPYEYDFLVVDDGSTDNSFLEFQRVQNKYPSIKMKYINHEKNLGYGNAIISIFPEIDNMHLANLFVVFLLLFYLVLIIVLP